MARTERAGVRDTLARLRRSIADIERDGALAKQGALADDAGFGMPGKGPAGALTASDVLATGCADFDTLIGGGLRRDALNELHGRSGRDAGALTGFLAALLSRDETARPVLWISSPDTLGEAGWPHGHGFAALGLSPNRLLLASVRHLLDALWIAEEAARTSGLAATVLDMRGHVTKAGLHETRRLHRRAQESGQPVFLLRHGTGRDEAAPSTAAPIRLIVEPAPSAAATVEAGGRTMTVPGAIGPPGFAVTIDKNKAGPAGNTHILHWSKDEHRFDSFADRHDLSSVRSSRGPDGKTAGGLPRARDNANAHPVRLFPDAGNRPDHAGTGGKRLAG